MSASTDKIWFFTPVLLDVEAFLALRERVSEVLDGEPDLGSRARSFVVIDDSAGRDPEMGRLAELEDVLVVEPPFNLGHQRAIVYGLRLLMPRVANGDIVVTLDADGEDRPEDLPRLVSPLLSSADGRRRMSLALRTKRREPWAFRLLYFFFKVFFRSLTGVVVRTGNFAAYHGELAKRILRHPHFDLCYSSTLVSLDLPTDWIPCERGSRYAGKSKMNFSRLLMHGLSMLMPFVDRIALRALLAFSITMVLAVVLSLVVVAIRLFSDSAIPGWATTTLLLLIVLSFLALGNFIVLFTVYSQSRGLSLAHIEQIDHERAGRTPQPTD